MCEYYILLFPSHFHDLPTFIFLVYPHFNTHTHTHTHTHTLLSLLASSPALSSLSTFPVSRSPFSSGLCVCVCVCVIFVALLARLTPQSFCSRVRTSWMVHSRVCVCVCVCMYIYVCVCEYHQICKCDVCLSK
jgi:hypothetical protein